MEIVAELGRHETRLSVRRRERRGGDVLIISILLTDNRFLEKIKKPHPDHSYLKHKYKYFVKYELKNKNS